MRVVLENRKSKCLAGIILMAVFAAGCFLTGGSVRAGIILAGLMLGVTFLRIEVPNEKVLKGIYGLVFALVPFGTFVTGQIVQSVGIFTVDADAVLLNVCIFLILQLLVLLVSANLRLSMTVGIIAPVIICLLNAYVYMFRGNEITPSDLLSIRTAANVAAEYDFTPVPQMIYAFAMTAVMALFAFSIPRLELKRTGRNYLMQVSSLAVCVIALLFGCKFQETRHWQNNGAQYNGFFLNFVLQLKESFVTEPEGYNAEEIQQMESKYPVEKETNASLPDIIVIMDESFADLTVFGSELSTNMEVMPFLDSLQENTVRGYLYASVFGGGTADSEYELLSGNSMAFLPQGAIVYQQYLSEEPYTLLPYLKELGYSCVAMHPYHANGWMRDTVYPNMGFDAFFSLEDFPQEQLIREYVSDREMFEEIIRMQEQQDEDTPLFLFGVTMQNHGGYTYEGPNYEKTISLEGYSQEYPEAEQYLSLIHETDKAIQYLIEYYENSDRDVVVVFFGDHMPKVENAFYEELNGGSFDTLDKQMRKQMVPFFIWANYDIEEKEVPGSSINYLSTYLLEAAGISLPPYQQFLKETESVIPAICAYGYYSLEKQGFLSLDEASGQEAEALRAYEMLQYNNLFDEENRNEYFFGK